MKTKFNFYIEQLQDKISNALADLDGESVFKEDIWEREGGGGGRTRIIENGTIFEKGGVNISSVHGDLPDSMKNYFEVDNGKFSACGLSLVMHLRIHMCQRFMLIGGILNYTIQREKFKINGLVEDKI